MKLKPVEELKRAEDDGMSEYDAIKCYIKTEEDLSNKFIDEVSTLAEIVYDKLINITGISHSITAKLTMLEDLKYTLVQSLLT